MKVVCISDLHGIYPEPQTMPEGDVLVIAGDCCEQDEYGLFKGWLYDLTQYGDIIVVPGNHDFDFYLIDSEALEDMRSDEMKGNKIHLLIDEGVEINGVKFWGTPWTPPFFDWAFMMEDYEIFQRLLNIPDDTDFLISHGPPLGHGDEAWSYEVGRIIHVGSYSLTKILRQRPNIKWTVYGHIHEGRQVEPYRSDDIDSLMYNVSYLDGTYDPYDLPLTIIDTEEEA